MGRTRFSASVRRVTHIHRPAPRPVVHHAPVRAEHHATPPAKPAVPPSATAHGNAARSHSNEGPHVAPAPRPVASPAHAPVHTNKTEPPQTVDRSKSPWGVDGFERPAHETDDGPIGEATKVHETNKAFDWLRTGITNAGEAGEAALASVNPLLRQGDLWLRQSGGHTEAITGVDTSRVNDAQVAQRVSDTIRSVAKTHGVNNVGVRVIEPGQWREQLRKQGISADDHDHIALYDARTHTILANSDLDKRGVEAQREVVREELTHADQNKHLTDVGPNGTNLAYTDQVGRIFREAKGTDDGSAVTSALAQGYERLAYTPTEAQSKAAHALENWAECDAALRVLWRSHPETNAALKQLCPQMDRALQREARGESLMRNTEFTQQLKDPARAKDFAKVHSLSETDEKKLERAVNSSWVPWHGIERLLDSKYDFSDRVRQSGTVHPGRWNNTASFAVAAVPSTARAAWSSPRVTGDGPASVSGYPAAQMGPARLSARATSTVKPGVATAAPPASSSTIAASPATARSNSPASARATTPASASFPANAARPAAASSANAPSHAWASVAPSAQTTTSQAMIQRAQVSARPIAAPQPPTPAPPLPTDARDSEAEAQAKAADAKAKAAQAQAQKEAREGALEQLIESDNVPESDGGHAIVQRALDTVDALKDAGHERMTDAVQGPSRAASQGARFDGDRVAGGRTIDDVVLKATCGALNGADFELLAHATQTPEGGRNLADALEWMISQPHGDRRMVDLLGQASQPGNTTAMAQALARIAQASPEQTLGLLLLTTDAAGGPAQMARLFGAMADKPAAAAQFATMFEGLTRTPQTAASMSEFLDVVTRASFDDHSGSRVMARLLRQSSAPAGGADSLVKGLSRTLETEGGARSFARVLGRISTSAADSATFLENLGNRESGTETVGRLMARATGSRDGARQVIDSFARMAGASGNDKKMGEVVARIIGSQSGSKFVSNLASDPQSARQLESTLAHLDAASPAVGDRLAKAFHHLMGGSEGTTLRARANESPALASIIDRFVDNRPTDPLAAPPEASLTASSARDFLARAGKPPRAEVTHAVAPVGVDPSTPPSARFRPADVYSESTLTMARICGDCGFRLTAGGRCVRCDGSHGREAATAGRLQAVDAF